MMGLEIVGQWNWLERVDCTSFGRRRGLGWVYAG
jgi:hypothetical protein